MSENSETSKIEHHKIYKLLKDPAVSNFVTRKWIEGFTNGQYFSEWSIFC